MNNPQWTQAVLSCWIKVLLNIICSPLAPPDHVGSDSPVFVPQCRQPHRFFLTFLIIWHRSAALQKKKRASHWGAETRLCLASQMSHLIPAQTAMCLTPERAKQLATESSQRWHTCYYSSASLWLSVYISVLDQWRRRSCFRGVKGCWDTRGFVVHPNIRRKLTLHLLPYHF